MVQFYVILLLNLLVSQNFGVQSMGHKVRVAKFVGTNCRAKSVRALSE